MLKYYQNTVLYNENIEKGVGIITGWKKPNLIKSHLTEETLTKVKTIGTLYTKNGINFVIANLFLNPEINHLVFLEDSDIDNTMSESIKAFLTFLDTEEFTFQEKFHYSKDKIHEFCTYFKRHISVIASRDLNEEIEAIDVSYSWRKDIL